MQETGAQSGVRSLLAKFESSSQGSFTSPPSRGRSPTGSEASGSGRPLSKVRASFIAVDRAAQSCPTSGLRTESGQDDSTALKGISSEEVSTALKSPLSFHAEGDLGEHKNDMRPKVIEAGFERTASAGESRSHASDTATAADCLPTRRTKFEQKQLASTRTAGKPLKQSPAAKAAAGRRSAAQAAKNKPATSATSKISSTDTTPPAYLHASAASAQTAGGPAARSVSQSVAVLAKSAGSGHGKGLTQKPSRISLNVNVKTTRAVKSTSKTTRASTTSSQERPPLPTIASPISPTSRAATSQSGIGTQTSNLNRKSSPLKDSKSHGTSASATIAASKKISRASLPAQSGSERPRSRLSNINSKPLDEGFLARMMRPTASSANKVHDKVEVKSPPRLPKVVRDQRTATPKSSQHVLAVTKEEDVSENVDTGNKQPETEQQALSRESKDTQPAKNTRMNVNEEYGEISMVIKQPAPETTQGAPGKYEEVPCSEGADGNAVEATGVASTELVESPVKVVTDTSVNVSAIELVGPDSVPVEDSSNGLADLSTSSVGTLNEQISAHQQTVPQHTSVVKGSSDEASSATEEGAPIILKPPADSTERSTDSPSYVSPDLREEPKVEHSAESSLEVSFVDTVEAASPMAADPDETPVDASEDCKEGSTVAMTTTTG